MLTDNSPGDAYLVKMHLEGLDYSQMAARSLAGKGSDQKELDRKINAIKKQFTREGDRVSCQIQELSGPDYEKKQIKSE